VTNEFLNIWDVVEYLGVKVSTVYARVERREIPHYKLGKLIKFKKCEIDEWLEKCRKEPVDPDRKAIAVLRSIMRPKGRLNTDIDLAVKKIIDTAKSSTLKYHHGKPEEKISRASERMVMTMGFFKRCKVWWMSFMYWGENKLEGLQKRVIRNWPSKSTEK
jgi:excisionase family DNA binding protein